MSRIAKWLSSKIETLILGTIESKINERLQAYLFGPSGDDSPPLDNDKIIMLKKEGTGHYVVCGVLCQSQGANPGEKILYSRNSSGVVQSTIKLLSNGTIEINGNTKSFVTHAELNTALQSMITTLNIEMAAIAAGATAAIGAAGLWLTPLAGIIGNNSVDISASETSTVKTGG